MLGLKPYVSYTDLILTIESIDNNVEDTIEPDPTKRYFTYTYLFHRFMSLGIQLSGKFIYEFKNGKVYLGMDVPSTLTRNWDIYHFYLGVGFKLRI